MAKQFLLQRKDEGEVTNSIMSENQLINFIDMLDCTDISLDDCNIYLISEFGDPRLCFYKGWQPGNLIEIEDWECNLVLSGYGTDH